MSDGPRTDCFVHDPHEKILEGIPSYGVYTFKNLEKCRNDPLGCTCIYCGGTFTQEEVLMGTNPEDIQKGESRFDVVDGGTTLLCPCGIDALVPTSVLHDKELLARANVTDGDTLLLYWHHKGWGLTSARCTCTEGSTMSSPKDVLPRHLFSVTLQEDGTWKVTM